MQVLTGLGAAASLQDVAAKVQADLSELCSRMDGLIESSPKEKGGRWGWHLRGGDSSC
jgi:hypothetical protein